MTGGGGAMLTLSHLRKVYPNGAVAVEDFSVEVPDGEFLVLVGPSGCGKSTTLRMVAGLEEATAGTIAIDGRVINALPPKDRDLAMVFQNYALYPHMTVRENMGFALRLRRLPKPLIAQRIADAAHALGLDALLDRLPRQLSGGQRQRVALGRALVRQPRLFLFDEPLSNLDAKMRVEMRHEIHRLHLRLRATILYVTHDQTEAMTLGDRIVVMDAGRIRQIADPLTLYDSPADRFVASFIGTPPMNLIPAVADGRGGLDLPGARLRPPEEAFPYLPAGRAALLGIRPEALRPLTDGRPAPDTLPATLDLLERMGAESYAHLTLPGGAPLIARLPPTASPRHGDTLRLLPDYTPACLFDPASGDRIG